MAWAAVMDSFPLVRVASLEYTVHIKSVCPGRVLDGPSATMENLAVR